MQLEIIARDVTTGCSGCLHKYIELNGSKTQNVLRLLLQALSILMNSEKNCNSQT